MSGLENLKTRVKYYGVTVEDRLNTDKLRTLKKALFNSYQAETIVLADGREFKCLINSDKLEKDYDDRYIYTRKELLDNRFRFNLGTRNNLDNLIWNRLYKENRFFFATNEVGYSLDNYYHDATVKPLERG